MSDRINGTDEPAQPAAYAFAVHFRCSAFIKGQRFVTAVRAGNNAPAAAKAPLTIKHGKFHGFAVKLISVYDISACQAYDFFETLKAVLGQKSLCSVYHILDYAIAVLHDRRCHLNI